MRYDNQEQPIYNINANIILNRDINEFIGICRGIAFDNEINYKEASSLLEWINNHNEHIQQFPINIIAPKLNDFLKNDELSPSDALALLELLKHLTGSYRHENITNPSTTLALDIKEQNCSDNIEFEKSPVAINGQFFVLTGQFTIGDRCKIATLISQLGGTIQKAVTQATNYVVIGAKGSNFWLYSTHGAKIKRAKELQQQKIDIKIIDETHLMQYLKD